MSHSLSLVNLRAKLTCPGYARFDITFWPIRDIAEVGSVLVILQVVGGHPVPAPGAPFKSHALLSHTAGFGHTSPAVPVPGVAREH